MVAWLKNASGFGASHHRTNRHARTQPFGQGHHVGVNTCPLVGKPFAGATNAALHLVNHQQPVLGVAQGANIAQVVGSHGVDAAFALDGLEKHRHHVGVALRSFFQGLDIVQRHPNKTFHQWTKALLDFGVAGGAQRGDAAAMKSTFVNHNFRSLNAFVVPKLAGHLQGGFVGL